MRKLSLCTWTKICISFIKADFQGVVGFNLNFIPLVQGANIRKYWVLPENKKTHIYKATKDAYHDSKELDALTVPETSFQLTIVQRLQGVLTA